MDLCALWAFGFWLSDGFPSSGPPSNQGTSALLNKKCGAQMPGNHIQWSDSKFHKIHVNYIPDCFCNVKVVCRMPIQKVRLPVVGICSCVQAFSEDGRSTASSTAWKSDTVSCNVLTLNFLFFSVLLNSFPNFYLGLNNDMKVGNVKVVLLSTFGSLIWADRMVMLTVGCETYFQMLYFLYN